MDELIENPEEKTFELAVSILKILSQQGDEQEFNKFTNILIDRGIMTKDICVDIWDHPYGESYPNGEF